MTYEDIEFVILAGLSAMAGVLLGDLLQIMQRGPSVVQFNGSLRMQSPPRANELTDG
jgi:hypothetical protein